MEIIIGERYGLKYVFAIIPYPLLGTYRIFSWGIINIRKKFSRGFIERNFRPWGEEFYKSTEEIVECIEKEGGVEIIKRVEWK